MKQIHNQNLRKLTLLNKTIAACMFATGNLEIIRNFTEGGLEMLEADYGFAWWKSDEKNKYEIAYKSKNAPKNPNIPKLKPAYYSNEIKKYFIDSDVKTEKYEAGLDRNLKSYLIIPVQYGHHVYGNVIFGYKEKHNFTEEDTLISQIMSNAIAQAITIHWLVEKEGKSVALAEKQKATEILLNEEKLKTYFIANTTHEFRTPLAIMRGNVELALNKKDLKSATRALKIVNTETIHLSNMLADLVILTSRKDAKDTLNFTPTDLKELLHDLVERLRPIANKKNINISLKTKPGSAFVSGDKKYLERLFLNLIENAVTYGKKRGKIMVDISQNKKDIVVKITDDGVGISKKDLPRIFERFYRADKARSYGQHSGLGLSMVKHITEMHNGKIEVKSSEGKGTTFTVSLPKAK